jgi:predicted  nucleic acid-binding Zn-ribbon protein
MNRIGSFDDFNEIPVSCDKCGELFSTDITEDFTNCPHCGYYIEIDETLLNDFRLYNDDYDILRETDLTDD